MPAEVGLGADRQLDRHGVRAEAVDHRLDALLEVRADAVHLVDVGDARHAVLVGLAPHRLGLRLDAGDGVEQRDRAVEHAQRALHLDGEVDVARRVDDVDAMVLPLGRGGRGGDRDAALLLLLHPVHRRRALVDLAHLVGAAGVVEDALGRRRLARVDVGHDPDVAGLLEAELARHLKGLFLSASAGGAGEKNGPFGPVGDHMETARRTGLCLEGLHGVVRTRRGARTHAQPSQRSSHGSSAHPRIPARARRPARAPAGRRGAARRRGVLRALRGPRGGRRARGRDLPRGPAPRLRAGRDRGRRGRRRPARRARRLAGGGGGAARARRSRRSAVVLAVDLPDVHETGLVGQTYEAARAEPRSALWLELAGAGCLVDRAPSA